MVFAVLHLQTLSARHMLLQPDADGMTGRPQVAADMQVQNLQKHFALGTCAQTGTS
jgi:hypothetical protein